MSVQIYEPPGWSAPTSCWQLCFATIQKFPNHFSRARMGAYVQRDRRRSPPANAFSQYSRDGKEASDDRVERSLYQLAIIWNGQPPNATACIFWLKNRRKDRWRDVQNIEADIGHILSDKPMTEDEWIMQRAVLDKPKQKTDKSS
jgi:hypothetical protein